MINIEKLIKEKENEISKLQLEIQQLRQLNNKSYNLFSLEEKINIFINYFKGRDDVYPYLSINKNNPEIKYYIPACINEWKKGVCNKTMGKKCKYCQYRENKPLTQDVIKNIFTIMRQ